MRQWRHAVARQELHGEIAGEERAQRRVEDVEPAGISAEGGQHQALLVLDEAAPGDPVAAHLDARLRVIMAAHLAAGEERLGDMAEGEGAEAERAEGDAAAELRGRRRIVIAGDPDQLVRG